LLFSLAQLALKLAFSRRAFLCYAHLSGKPIASNPRPIPLPQDENAMPTTSTDPSIEPSGTKTRDTANQMCPICMDSMLRPIQLSCTHILCTPCAAKCSTAGMQACPVCRHPHLLDPQLLQERRAEWRSAYGNWRLGRAKGAVGELSSIAVPNGSDVSGNHQGSALVHALDLADVRIHDAQGTAARLRKGSCDDRPSEPKVVADLPLLEV